jgi:hypothetical protein
VTNLDSSVDDQELVCPCCYRKVRERIDAQKIIREERDYRDFGEDDRCYLYILSGNPNDVAEVLQPIDDRVEETEKGLYCQFCGTDINARERGSHRSTTEAVEHAGDLADVYEAHGYNVDREALVERVRELKSDPAKTGKEYEVFREALREALRR